MLRILTKVILIALAAGGLTVRGEDAVAVTGQYWFDGTGERHTFTPGSFEISTDGLQDGLHTLHAYVDDGSAVSSTHTRWFLKRRDLTQGEEVLAEIHVDSRLFQSHKLRAGADGTVDINLDMAGVDPGVHSIGVSLSSSQGLPMGYRNGVFLKVPTEQQMSTFGVYYFLDGEYIGSIDPRSADGVYHLDIDASALTSGLHSVTAYLASPHGLASSTETAWFVKIPEGGEGVTQYSYWINDDLVSAQTKKLPEVTNPFALVSLVDVPIQPLRSKSYTFAVENKKPVFYACNDFTVQFFDPDGRVSTASRTYTDTRVKQTAEDVMEISAGKTATGTISENAIKLYRFDAEIGDSIGVNLDRAATIEVYDPEAATLIKASGADAKNRNTFTARKNGTYYVAVHDVVNGNSANIDFAFVHKFALLEQSVGKSANRGAFETKVIGNGFESLESLVLAGGDAEYEIPQYRVVDNNTLYALVDIDEHPMPIGEYRFKGVFKDKDKGGEETILSSSRLTLEEATPGNIDVEIKPSFKVGTPYMAYINITNTGNVGCWGIPLNIAARNASDVAKIDFVDFAILMDDEFKDTMPIYHHTNDLLGTGQEGAFAPTVIPFLAPGETQTYTIGLTTEPHELVTLYAWAGEPWSEEARKMISAEEDFGISSSPFSGNIFTFVELCKLFHQLDSTGNLDCSEADLPELRSAYARSGGKTANIVYSVAKAGAYGCGNSVGRNGTYMVGQGISLSGNSGGDNTSWSQITWMPFLHNLRTIEFANRMFALGARKVNIKFTKEGLKNAATARGDWTPSVPPDPHNPAPSVIEGYQSGDPNDMKGYVSPAGTNHIGKDVRNVTYTIEFENDPEIANASAARIKVYSTLDGKKLDLSSLRALKLTLGDKEIDLPDGHHFVRTLDMRSAINAIAELTFDFDSNSGEAEWSLRSLNPLTLEDISYMDDGILPVNDDSGRGTGYLTFSVDLLSDLKDAEPIQSQAVIVFDDNKPISTPVWSNVTDYTLPTSKIVSQSSDDNRTFNFTVKGDDSGSGIWCYDLYMRRAGAKQWTAVKTQIEEDTFSYTAPEVMTGVDFAVLATDKAGNRQDEAWLKVLIGDSDGNGIIDSNDAVAIVTHYTGMGVNINRINADVTGEGKIDTQDATAIVNLYLSNVKDNKVKKLRIK